MMVELRGTVALFVLLMTAALPVAAQDNAPGGARDWPSRPIHFVVPFPAGGSTDVGARVMANALTRVLGQQIVVENKSGASGNVGFEAAARSAPDGYTVLIAPDQLTSAPHVFKVGFDPLKDSLPSSSCRGSRSCWRCIQCSVLARFPSWLSSRKNDPG